MARATPKGQNPSTSSALHGMKPGPCCGEARSLIPSRSSRSCTKPCGEGRHYEMRKPASVRVEDGFTPGFEAAEFGCDQKGCDPALRATCHVVVEAARRTRAAGSGLC